MKKVINFLLFNIVKKILDFILAIFPVKLDKDKKLTDVIFVGHRGIKGNNKIKENTFEAFDLAVKSGCNGLELDVHLTADDKVVINHDRTLKRVFGINLDITDTKFNDIKNVFSGIILLEDFINYYQDKDIYLFIEIKKQISEKKDEIFSEKIIKILKDNKVEEKCIIISLYYETLLNYTEYGIKLFPIYLFFPKKAVDFAEKYNLSGVFGNYILTGKRHIKKILKHGLQIGTGFLEYKNSIYREINKGVKIIFNDRADKVIPKILKK